MGNETLENALLSFSYPQFRKERAAAEVWYRADYSRAFGDLFEP